MAYTQAMKRDLGDLQSVHARFKRWSKMQIWKKLFHDVIDQLDNDEIDQLNNDKIIMETPQQLNLTLARQATKRIALKDNASVEVVADLQLRSMLRLMHWAIPLNLF